MLCLPALLDERDESRIPSRTAGTSTLPPVLAAKLGRLLPGPATLFNLREVTWSEESAVSSRSSSLLRLARSSLRCRSVATSLWLSARARSGTITCCSSGAAAPILDWVGVPEERGEECEVRTGSKNFLRAQRATRRPISDEHARVEPDAIMPTSTTEPPREVGANSG